MQLLAAEYELEEIHIKGVGPMQWVLLGGGVLTLLGLLYIMTKD